MCFDIEFKTNLRDFASFTLVRNLDPSTSNALSRILRYQFIQVPQHEWKIHPTKNHIHCDVNRSNFLISRPSLSPSLVISISIWSSLQVPENFRRIYLIIKIYNTTLIESSGDKWLGEKSLSVRFCPGGGKLEFFDNSNLQRNSKSNA